MSTPRLHVTTRTTIAILAALLLWGCASTPSAPRATAETETRWAAYYDRTGEREPRRLLLEALDFFEKEGRTPRHAVDAGCGTGVEARFLARMGAHVLAFDAEPEGIRRLRGALSDTEAERIETRVARFHEADWGRDVDLVFAGFALPFARPDDFPIAWRGMTASLSEGGRFVGHLFGDRDGWAQRPEMTHHQLEQVEALLAGAFDVEVLREVERDAPTAGGALKHWHFYEIIARKR